VEVSVRRLLVLLDELCAALATFEPARLPGDECASLAEA
jgi:hypothetical protein